MSERKKSPARCRRYRLRDESRGLRKLSRSGRHDKICGVKKQTIHPAKFLTGGVAPPGDKSISHRYAMLSALAEGTSELRHFALAADCHSTLDCMSALGASVKVDKDVVRVTGRGAEGLKSSWRALDAGNSGTTIRLLTGILAGQNFTTKLSGDASIQKRPMGRVVSPLRQMGADIRAREDNFAPLEIHGTKLARHSLRNADGERAGEIGGAAGGIVCRRHDIGDRTGA